MGDDTLITFEPSTPYRQTRTVSHIFIHPGYVRQTYEHDIAVMRVGSMPFGKF